MKRRSRAILAALAEWHFVHRSMVEVSRPDLSAELFGREMPIPVAVAPSGLNELFWPHADLRLAEAAAEVGVPFAQSTMSNDAMARSPVCRGCVIGGSSTFSGRPRCARL